MFRSLRALHRSLVPYVFIATFLAAPSTAQILEIHADSLTTYEPTGQSTMQLVRPLHTQRGVNIDGSLRSQPGLAMALQGNPFESIWVGKERQDDLRIDIGAYAPFDVDIALPAAGFSFVIGRTYNPLQENSGASHIDSNGYQGQNWFQTSQPEILFYDDNDNAKDLVYLIYGADRFVELKRKNSSSNQFQGTNGAAGCVNFVAGGASVADTYVYTDQHGNEITFFGFDVDAGVAAGQFWKMADPDGNTAYVGDATTAATAISAGYDGSGRIIKAFDSGSLHRFTYTYTTLNSVVRLTQVKAETKASGSWASPSGVQMVMQVDYAYYGNESYGDIGDLKQATITERLSNSTDDGETVDWVKKKYYRYWEGSSDGTSSYNGSTNPGYVHGVKLVVDAEGTRRFDWTDTTFDEDFLTASTDDLKPYSHAYFEYDSSRRVSKGFFNGECGCSGSGNGLHEFSYDANSSYSDTSGYQTTWAKRTIIEKPDASYVTQVFDETSQGLSRIVTDIIPSSTSPAPQKWITHVTRDSAGRAEWMHTPANVTGYTHSTNSITTDLDDGLVHKFPRIGSGDMTGFLSDRRWQEGADTDPGNPVYFDQTLTWTSLSKAITDVTVVRPLVASERVYSQAVTSGTTDSYLTSYSYSSYSSTISPETRTTTHPTVSTGNNGSNTATSAKHHFDRDGRIDFELTEDNIVNYWKWTNGQQELAIEDADTNHADLTGVTIPTGFTSSGTELHKKTELTYSPQGKKKKSGTSGGTAESYRSRLLDQRLIELDYSEFVDNTHPTADVWYGPVGYSVINQTGKVEATGVIALSSNSTTTALSGHIDETDADPITAADLGSVAQMATSIYAENGTELEEARQYFLIPGSGAGSDGTNYDPTKFGYDDSGRRWRTKEASGTIRRTVFDIHGKVTEQWIGTNDSSFTGGESSGTDNMVKTTILQYDGGLDDGNHLVTSRTLRVQDSSTNERVTTYAHDLRGNVLLETTPLAPFAFHKYDNMDRRIATGLFSSTASIAYASDDPTTETTNRLALSQSFYDEKGQAWKTQRHQIDDADGSNDDNLQVLSWFDAVGRVIKVDGPQLTKTKYDRLGRETNRYTLAKDNDSTYAHAADVAGDIVLEEHNRAYDGTEDLVLLEATVSRFHNDNDTGSGETTGPLDEGAVLPNGDTDLLKVTAADVAGRVQITGFWYDSLDRLQDRVEFGTYAAADFDRDGLSVPSRSDTALRWTYTYNTDGTTQQVEDPKALVTRWVYDAAGRKTKEVRHYDAGVNSGNPSGTDDNVTVTYGYTDGSRTTLTADLPSGQSDQVTTYTYGTVKGASAGDSKIATGHLLQKVAYPDSSGASDTVTFAYNAQSQEIWKKDQAGNVFETDMDGMGRATHRRVTTLAGGFDGAVRRISTTYDGLSRRQLVTQYDNAAVGSGSVADEVKYTYDDWGNVEKFEQDRDSAVSGGGNDYEISYVYVTMNTTGRNTIKRTDMTLPSGNVITNKYRFNNGKHDLECSRVTGVYDDTVGLAHYEYNGVGHLVGTDLVEADVMWNTFTSTPGDYADLDRFNRVIKSKWTKDLATDKDFYSVVLTYDRNSNITSADDSVHAGFDVKYTMDDVDRLVQAEEGTLSSGSITSKTRDQQWTLTHVGNWDYDKVDLNGDSDFVDTDELNDHRTHNDVNELTGRDTDNSGTDNYSLTYDAVGNLTDDAKEYEYEYDAFGRLRKVKKTTDQSLVAEYRYNGLGYKIAVHADTDTDGDVDSNDKWYYDAFDERWRVVARFRESDSSPKEEFVYHGAGDDGQGRSSYIDTVICRYKDANTAWTSASDGVLEERIYYCQNWRADVSAIVTSTGQMKEWVKYSAYGIPFGLPGGDTDSNGDSDATDVTQVQTWINGSAYDVRGDADLDGDVDVNDKTLISSSFSGVTLARGQLSQASLANRHGVSGLQQASHTTVVVARSRALDVYSGRWNTRDSLGYAEALNLYLALRSNPVNRVDPLGKASVCAASSPSVPGGAPGQGGQNFPGPNLGPRSEMCHTDQPNCGVGPGSTIGPISDGFAIQVIPYHCHPGPCGSPNGGAASGGLAKEDGGCAPVRDCKWDGNLRLKIVKCQGGTCSHITDPQSPDYQVWHGPEGTTWTSDSSSVNGDSIGAGAGEGSETSPEIHVLLDCKQRQDITITAAGDGAAASIVISLSCSSCKKVAGSLSQ